MRSSLRRRVVFGIVAGVVGLIAVSASYAQDQRSQTGTGSVPNVPAGDVKRGSALYLSTGCWECHGYTGATGSGAPLVLSGLSASGFVSYLRNPRTRAMPLYSAKVMSDAAAADLYAYIKTFKRPADVKEIPLLQQILSEQ